MAYTLDGAARKMTNEDLLNEIAIMRYDLLKENKPDERAWFEDWLEVLEAEVNVRHMAWRELKELVK